MLKKLVIVGSLLAVGPLLAGCPGAVVFGVTQVAAPLLVAGVEALDNTSSTSAASVSTVTASGRVIGIKNFSNEKLCHYVATFNDKESIHELTSRVEDCSGNSSAAAKLRAARPPTPDERGARTRSGAGAAVSADD